MKMATSVVVPWSWWRHRSVVPVLILLSALYSSPETLLIRPVGAIEATFTPSDGNSPEDAGGPLPLSQAQRDQLTQLDQTISQSSDPQSTLAKIAEGNGMTPQELGDLLMRNRRDMAMASGGNAGGGMMVANVPRKIVTVLASLVMAVSNMARRDPRRFAMIAAGLFLVMHVIISAPRTGIVTSRGPKPLWLSHGFTTFLPPPKSFVLSYLTSEKFRKRSMIASFGASGGGMGRKALPTIGFSRRMSDILGGFDDDGITLEKVGRRSERNRDLAYSVTARRRIPLESLSVSVGRRGNERRVGDGDEDGDDDDDDNAAKTRHQSDTDAEAAADLAFDSALSVLSSRRFAEFVGSDDAGSGVGGGGGGLWFHSSGRTPASASRGRRSRGGRRGGGEGDVDVEEGAALVMKSMGDLGRYGVQPLRVAYEEESRNRVDGTGADAEEEASVAFYTVRGGHFDGEVRFSVERRTGSSSRVDGEGKEEDGVVVSVSLLVPKKGRKMRAKLAEKLVSTLASSIAKSTLNEARTTIARQSQSGRYLGMTRDLAVERRSIRVENERRREEMARDRRRRWQRNNPDAGRYRPSGHRMISPNNC